MKRVLIVIVEVAAVVLLAGGAYYLWNLRNSGAPLPAILAPTAARPSPTGAASPMAATVPGPAPTQFPIPPEPSPTAGSAPVPTVLDESDAAFERQLASLLGQLPVERLFNTSDIIRRIVATTINATAKSLPSALSPFKPLGSPFISTQGGQGPVLSEENFARYANYVKAISDLNVTRAAAVYIRFYPLFQSAYADLGTPGYFNDRLVEAIDNCLNAPDPKPPVALIQPTLMFKFADPKLESLSAAQKILVRLGPENAIAVKEKLRQFRELIAHRAETH